MAESYFGENLKRLRKERGLTQAQLADMIMTNRVSVCEWETGATYPQIIWIYEIADKLGVSPSELVEQKCSK